MLKILKQLWEAVSHADTLKSLWDQRTFIGSFVLSVIVSFWAWIQEQTSSIIFTVGVVLFFVVYLVSIVAKYPKGKEKNEVIEPIFQKKDTIDLGCINDEGLILDLSQASSFRAHLDSNCVLSIKASSEQTQRFQLFISGLKKHSLGFEAKLKFSNDFYENIIKSDSGEGYIFGFSNDSGRTFILSSQSEGHIGTVETFIKLSPASLTLHGDYKESSNVSSVIHDSKNMFVFTFEKPIGQDFKVTVEGNKSIEFDVVSKTPSSAKIRFYGGEQELVKLIFKSEK
jgi:hypothetical protein